MEENLVNGAETVKSEEQNAGAEIKPAQTTDKTEKTFTREQLNRYISVETEKARQSEREKVLNEIKEQQSEAERLAKLSETQRQEELLNSERAARTKAEKELSAYKLKEQTLAENKDIPRELIDLIDFTVTDTAEKVLQKVDIIRSAYKSSLENGVNAIVRERTPKTKGNSAPDPRDLLEALKAKYPNR